MAKINVLTPISVQDARRNPDRLLVVVVMARSWHDVRRGVSGQSAA
jgi:hypothetical protein